MIRMMIADDEYLIRWRIAHAAEWAELGIEIVGEAEDGEQALELIESARPHLLIVDINMPFLDGLALSRIVRERRPDIKIVILTGYDEFEYARQAVASGVFSYLVKPINEGELKDTVLAARKEIEQSLSYRSYVADLEHEFRVSRNRRKDELLGELAAGSRNGDAAEWTAKLASCGIALSPVRIRAAVLEIDYLEQTWSSRKERELMSFAVANIGGDILSAHTNAAAFVGADHRTVCLFNDVPDVPAACQSIRDKLKQFYRLDITIGLGSVHDGFDRVRQSCDEARQALEAKFYLGRARTIDYAPGDATANDSYPYEPVDKDGLLLRLRTGDAEQAEAEAAGLFAKLEADRAPAALVRTAALECMAAVLAFAAESRLPAEDRECLDFVGSRQTLQDMKQAVLERLRKTAGDAKRAASGPSRLVRAALEHIERNYGDEELSLSDAAASLYVNPSYLSTVFKKELNCSFSDYVVEYRLKKAKEWLDRDSELPIGFVAHRVGYGDPLYFGKSFKKKFGVSPAAYCELKRGAGKSQ